MTLITAGSRIKLKNGKITWAKRILANRETGDIAVQDIDGELHPPEDCHLEEESSQSAKSKEEPGRGSWHGIPPHEWDC